MSSLLYPAMQKLYSALSSLEKFSKENNFFENISSLDIFFSEFRNITFVLQKSLAHTDFIDDYNKLRDEYLSECRWFIEKRNETTKQQPFQLVKKIDISIYHPNQGYKICSYEFTIKDDVEMSTLLDELKQLFSKLHPIEVFFSVEFSFYEVDTKIDIYEKISFGINQIKLLLNELKIRINQNCDLCDKLESAFNNFHFSITLKDVFFTDDYVYYPKMDLFERADRMAFSTDSVDVSIPRQPINNERWHMFGAKETSFFDKFVMLHIMIGTADLMPTTMIVYDDETYEMDTYHSTIKTTAYRKTNETAMKIANNNVKEVYVMQTYTLIETCDEIYQMTSKERLQKGTQDILIFMKVDSDLNKEEYFFEEKNIRCENYLVGKLREGSKKHLEYGKLNMQPIINAFKSKKEGAQ